MKLYDEIRIEGRVSQALKPFAGDPRDLALRNAVYSIIEARL